MADLFAAAAEALRSNAAPAPPPDDRPTFLDVDGYAEHMKISAWKVRQLCKLGLPHSRLPGGRKLIRIDVKKADDWVRAQGSRV